MTPTPPRPIARPGGSSGGSSGVDADLAEAGGQPRRADGVEQAHGRHVERQLQRLPDADVALVAHVEIARPVAGEIGRPVLDQRLLRDQALLHGEAVDERLQRRARRADGPGHVDPAGAAGIEEIGRADLAEDLAGLGVGQHHGDRQLRAELLGGLPGDRLQPFLDAPADGQLVDVLGRRVLQRGAGGMRRQAPAAPGAMPATSSAGRAVGLALVDQAGAHHARQHAVARGVRAGEVAVGPAALRQLRQRDQQRRLRQRQPLRLLAEIGERGSADAFEIAAIGRQRQIELEDLALAHAPFDLDGAQDLLELGAERAAFARLHQARELHRQRRAARDDAAVAGELAGGAQQAPARRRPHGPRSACPRRRPASSTNCGSTASRSAASRQRPSGVAKARSSAPSRSTTSVETGSAGRRRRVGAVGPVQRRPGEREAARDAAQCACATRAAVFGGEMARSPRRAGNLAFRVRQAEQALPCQRRLDLHLPGRGAGREFRPVHVLDARRRMGVGARRHGAHDIGQRDVAVGALRRGRTPR